MDNENIVRVAMAKETRKRLRQIASLTDETLYDVVERLAVAEQKRLREAHECEGDRTSMGDGSPASRDAGVASNG
jgi:hypothetical protein